MRVARAIAFGLTAAVLFGACSAKVTASVTGVHGRPPISSIAPVGLPTPSPTARPPSTGYSVPGYIVPPPDAEGNPACPVSDAWGKDPSESGIFISYWADGTDYVTVLVRTANGTDIAQSANIGADEQLHLFDFADIDSRAVKEVLITTNEVRCFATPDPATSGR
jgi:hypothetical protein